MTESVLVTGAQGFIGRYVVAALLADNTVDHVIGIGRSPRNNDQFTHKITSGGNTIAAQLPNSLRQAMIDCKYRYFTLNLIETEHVTNVIRHIDPEITIHLAGSLRDESFDRLVDNNIYSTFNLCSALASLDHPARLVMASSGSVYGNVGANGQSLSDTTCPRPIDMYAATKLASEDIAFVVGAKSKLNVTAARIFNVIGPGQEERHLVGHLASQLADLARGHVSQIRVGPLVTRRDFIDVRDVAAAIVTICHHDEIQVIYNVASSQETHVQLVFDELIELSGCARPRIERTPGRTVDLSRQVVDVSRLRELGWRPRFSIRQSLDDVLRYYLNIVG